MSISCWGVAILEFYLLLASHVMKNCFIEFLDLENMGTIDVIVQLYCIPTEIFKYFRFVIHHLGFLSDNIEAIIVPLYSPTISRKSRRSIPVSSMRFGNCSRKIGLGGGNFTPHDRGKVKTK